MSNKKTSAFFMHKLGLKAWEDRLSIDHELLGV